jgi:hypothetical protein
MCYFKRIVQRATLLKKFVYLVSYGVDCEWYCILECHRTYIDKLKPTFRRNLLLPSSEYHKYMAYIFKDGIRFMLDFEVLTPMTEQYSFLDCAPYAVEGYLPMFRSNL